MEQDFWEKMLYTGNAQKHTESMKYEELKIVKCLQWWEMANV